VSSDNTETFLHIAGGHCYDTGTFLQIAADIQVIPKPSCRLQRDIGMIPKASCRLQEAFRCSRKLPANSRRLSGNRSQGTI